jgi:hypothetical protein
MQLVISARAPHFELHFAKPRSGLEIRDPKIRLDGRFTRAPLGISLNDLRLGRQLDGALLLKG